MNVRLLIAVPVALLLAACGKSSTTLGEGGSVVSGSAGPAGAHHASRELVKCESPVATMALVENPNGYSYSSSYQLPASPVPLVRLLAQQSGCFRVVDRAAGLKATVREQELKEAGILRQQGNTVAKGKGYEAQYSLTPSLTFSEQDAGRQIGGILQAIPYLNKLVGAAGAGWSNTNEGKVIAAAFLDAHNQLVAQVRALQAKELPPAVATRKATGA